MGFVCDMYGTGAVYRMGDKVYDIKVLEGNKGNMGEHFWFTLIQVYQVIVVVIKESKDKMQWWCWCFRDKNEEWI